MLRCLRTTGKRRPARRIEHREFFPQKQTVLHDKRGILRSGAVKNAPLVRERGEAGYRSPDAQRQTAQIGENVVEGGVEDLMRIIMRISIIIIIDLQYL